MRLAILVTLVSLLSGNSEAFAGGSKTIGITGKIYSFDENKVVIEDSKKQRWVIPRSLLKKDFELNPGEEIGLWVPESKITPYKPVSNSVSK